MEERGFKTPISIKTAIENIDSNRYLIPAIQRKFVWRHFQIEDLFDSIMRDYPINSFMLWQVTDPKIKNTFKFYKFITHFRERYHENNEDISTVGSPDFSAVIDGQQRLTSIYVGLKGSYAYKMPRKWWADDQASLPTRHLYLDLSGPVKDLGEGKRLYNFSFRTKEEVEGSKNAIWFKVGDILAYEEPNDLEDFMGVQEWSANKFAKNTLRTLRKRIFDDKTINYYNETNQDIDSVLDIFIRTNSGGVPLSFSNLLMSITTANWDLHDARAEFESLVRDVNQIGKPSFWIDGDFILKTCLVLFNDNIRFMVKNFDHASVTKYDQNWDGIRKAIVQAFRLVEQWGYNQQTLRATNAVIPLVYYIYNDGNVLSDFTNTVKYKSAKAKMRKWLNIVLIKGTFASQTDYVLTGTRKAMKPLLGKDFALKEIMEEFKDNMTKNLTFSDSDIESVLLTQKDDGRADSIMSLLYSDFYFGSVVYNKDHLHPASYFRNLRPEDCASQQEFEHLTNPEFWNSIVNLQLLDESSNKSKQDVPLETWIKTARPDCKAQLIPTGVSYAVEDIDEFMEARKKLLVERFKEVMAGIA